MLKKTLRHLMRLLIALFCPFATYGISAIILGHIHIKPHTPHQHEPRITLYLISNGVHTDIAMPFNSPYFDWQQYVSPSHTRQQANPTIRYVAIGWGDKGFYLNTPTWADLTASTALRAISGFNQTVLHVSFYSELNIGENIIAIEVSSSQYRRLANNIAADFQTTNGKSSVIADAHYHNNDAFYEAHGQYSLFNTCNTWLNRHLKQTQLGGVYWTPFSGSLMNAHRHFQQTANPNNHHDLTPNPD